MNSEVEIAPMRSLDDFLLASARFQVPNFKDLERWSNRVCSNLLYYQTNYFYLSVVVFLLVGFIHNPFKICCGIMAMCAFLGLITNSKRLAKCKQDHPVIGLIVFLIILIIVYFLGYMLSSVQFLYGIMLPVALIFMHASMRLRNLSNKVVNKIEAIGVKKTPMGLFLEGLRQEYLKMKNV